MISIMCSLMPSCSATHRELLRLGLSESCLSLDAKSGKKIDAFDVNALIQHGFGGQHGV